MVKRAKHPNSLANLRAPIKPGEALNPRGRVTAGAYLREHVNAMMAKNLTADQLRRINRNPKESIAKRAAALRLLRTVEEPDIADFEPFLDGSKTLEELKAEGKDTSIIKSTKRTPGKFGDSRSIEMHDRSGDDFDRVTNHTEPSADAREKYARIDEGLSTERFDGVQIIVPGLPANKPE